MSKEKYYITTAIAYTSRKPHIGNSYEIVLTDAIARYKRMQGYDVFFLTGTDEHGQKIEEYAKNAGVSPKEYVDKVAGEIRGICDLLNTTYDKFIRTTDDYHEKVVQKIFRKLYDQGDIYKSEYEGMYCVPCESFFTESQVVDGKCPDCGSELVPTKEEAYFLRMSKYQKQLEDAENRMKELQRQYEALENSLEAQKQAADNIARLSLREANEIIDTAQKNADSIIHESLVTARLILSDLSKLYGDADTVRDSTKKKLEGMIQELDEFRLPKMPDLRWLNEAEQKMH